MIYQSDYNATVAIDIKAPLDAIWAGLTKPELVKQYMHGSTIVTDWQVGGSILWQGIWDSKPYQDKGIVLQYEPNKLLSYSHWSPLSGSEDKPDNYHVITISLTEMDGVIRLGLTQSNNPSQAAADSMASNGWLPMMQSLKVLVEKPVL